MLLILALIIPCQLSFTLPQIQWYDVSNKNAFIGATIGFAVGTIALAARHYQVRKSLPATFMETGETFPVSPSLLKNATNLGDWWLEEKIVKDAETDPAIKKAIDPYMRAAKQKNLAEKPLKTIRSWHINDEDKFPFTITHLWANERPANNTNPDVTKTGGLHAYFLHCNKPYACAIPLVFGSLGGLIGAYIK